MNKGIFEKEEAIQNITMIIPYIVNKFHKQILDLPNFIYHYTNAKGLMGIFNENSLWATHHKFLNDNSEFEYGISLVISIAEKKLNSEIDKKYKEYLTKIIQIIRNIDKYDENIYLFCFCRDGNLLSQWRGYTPSKGGYSLGFSTNHVRSLLGIRSNLFKVIYNAKTQKNIISEIIELGWLHLQKSSGPLDLRSTNMIVNKYLLFMCAIFKNPAFREENEYRIIVNISSISYPIYFRERCGLVTPYVSIPINQKNKKFPIQEIIIGPTLENNIAELGVNKFLPETIKKSINVIQSKIPLRQI